MIISGLITTTNIVSSAHHNKMDHPPAQKKNPMGEPERGRQTDEEDEINVPMALSVFRDGQTNRQIDS